MNDWISVKDRLPEPSTTPLLVYGLARNDPASEAVYGLGYYPGAGEWCMADEYGEPNRVTHWMSLPAPPELSEWVSPHLRVGERAKYGDLSEGDEFICRLRQEGYSLVKTAKQASDGNLIAKVLRSGDEVPITPEEPVRRVLSEPSSDR